jgi:glycine/D-amino acid oxidase-like deaminating enzyme
VDEAPFDVFIDRESTGVVQVALEESDLEEAGAHAAFLSGQGIGVEALTSTAAVHDVEPALADGLPGVWFVDHGRRVDPGALTVALATLAAMRGAVVRHHLHARALHAIGDVVRGVVTDEGVLLTDAVVVAAGPWSLSLLEPVGVQLPVWSVRGWLVRVAPRQPRLVRHIVERVGWTGAGHLGVRPAVSGLRAASGANIGAALHPGEDGTITCGSSWQHATSPEPEDPSIPVRIADMTARVVPALRDAEVRSAWWGLRPVTPDDRPIVDRVKDGLFVATGHGALGVILGAGTAGLVAADVLGREPPFNPAAFRAGRFDPGTG